MRAFLAGAAAVAVLLTGCSGDDDGNDGARPAPSPSATTPAESPAATTEPTVTASPLEPADDPTASAPTFTANTEPDSEEPSGEVMSVIDVRVGRHTGFDRVVYELAPAKGAPGWLVQYVDETYAEGSGDPIEVDGEAYLQVLVRGVGYPTDTGQEEFGQRRLRAPGLRSVEEIYLGGTYEGQYDGYIGLGGKKPFRVYRLANPPRVVIDIRDS